MGTWGSGSFENDDAMDWVYELEERGVKALDAALSAISDDEEEYVEAPDAVNAIAAAEVVAAALGKPAKDLPEEVTAWVESKPKLKPNLVTSAIAAVERVQQSSELKELWDDADPKHAKAWSAGVADLLKRLRSVSKS